MKEKAKAKKQSGRTEKKLTKTTMSSTLSEAKSLLKKNADIIYLKKDSLFESSVTANITVDINLIVRYANTEFLNIWGFDSPKDVIGKPLSVFMMNAREMNLIIDSLNKTGFWEGSFIAIKSNGSSFISEGIASIIQNDKGEIVGYKSSNIDVTSYKKEDELHRNEFPFRRIFEEGPLGMAFVNESYKFMKVNPALRKMTGYTEQELLGLTFPEITHPDYIKISIENTDRLYKRVIPEYKTEKIYVKKNKELFWGSVTVSHIHDNTGNFHHFFVLIEDITERKKAETALKISENKYRKLHETMMDGFIYLNMEGKIIESNESFRNMLGYEQAELAKLTNINITPAKWHDYESKILSEQILIKGYSDVYEKEYIKKDRTIFPVELHTFLIKDENGNNEGMWAIVRDITERKRTQTKIINNEEKLRKYSEELEKLNTAKDKFFKIIAHDLKSPFHSLQNMTSMIIDEIDSMDKGKILTIITKLNVLIKNQYKLLENMLFWSQIQMGRMEYNPVDILLSKSINQVFDILNAALSEKNINPVNSVPANTVIRADKNMLNSILQNLIYNAVKFTNPGGKVEVGFEDLNGLNKIFVSDTGTGITEEMQKKIFKTEFGSSSIGTSGESGTGLGLMLCKEMVEMHGGIISFDSEPGKGTTFYFTIPK
jgi:PAS domain S-box-containing protein